MKEKLIKEIRNSKRNIIINGSLSTGKTNNVVFPLVNEIIEKKESFFVIDTKDEYINKYYDEVKKQGYDIVILNLNEIDKSEGWNPFEYPYKLHGQGKEDLSYGYIYQMAQDIFYEEDPDSFWANSAVDYFTGLIIGIFEDGKPEEVNLCSGNKMLEDVDNLYYPTDYVTEYIKLKEMKSSLYDYASPTALAPDETKEVIISVAKQNLRPFITGEKLKNLLNKTTFNFEDIIKKPTAIFFLTNEKNATINALAPIFVNQLFYMLTENEPKNKFNFILDNFDIINHFHNLKSILSRTIKENMQAVIVTRDKDNLIKKYTDYINKLCNVIDVTEKEIKFNIENEEKNITNEFTTLKETKSNVIYPTLVKDKISLFDVEKFIGENGVRLEEDLKCRQFVDEISSRMNKIYRDEI